MKLKEFPRADKITTNDVPKMVTWYRTHPSSREAKLIDGLVNHTSKLGAQAIRNNELWDWKARPKTNEGVYRELKRAHPDWLQNLDRVPPLSEYE